MGARAVLQKKLKKDKELAKKMKFSMARMRFQVRLRASPSLHVPGRLQCAHQLWVRR
jgi:hypothetical protein